MAWLEERDPFRRMVMLALSRAAMDKAEGIVQNGVADAFSEGD